MNSIIKLTVISVLITGAIATAADTFTYDNYSNNDIVIENSFHNYFERREILDESLKYIGYPYVWGGETPKNGFDCSGLVKYVYKEVGIDVPRTSEEQMKFAVIIDKEEANIGDLVFFGDPAYHVGIWMGNDQMIHAPNKGEYIRIDKLGNYDNIKFGRYL